MSAPHRRGACPGLSAPMPTGDGLLVRFTPAGPPRLDAFVAACKAAQQHGNGTIEITARGSLQVRGLTPRSAQPFASALAALDIVAPEGVPVIADPLAGDPATVIDADGLAAELRRAIADARLALAPKVSVVVDGGGHLHLDALAADLRLRAIASAGGPRLLLALGGDAASAVPLGSIRPEAAADVTVALLSALAAEGREARAADILREGGIAPFRSRVEAHLAPALLPSPRPPAEAIGRHPLRDGSVALGIAPAFGHAQAEAFVALARSASGYRVRAIRPAPSRALLLIGVAPGDAAGLTASAEQLGFVVRADDPRRRITACSGKPACTSGLIATRALAVRIAAHLAPARTGIAVHVSGCAKGCAHPAPAALTLVGTEQGCGVIYDGTARAQPHHTVDPEDAAAEVVPIATPEAVHG